jgi:hypothetical protein
LGKRDEALVCGERKGEAPAPGIEIPSERVHVKVWEDWWDEFGSGLRILIQIIGINKLKVGSTFL